MAEHDTKISKSKDGGLIVRCATCQFAMSVHNEDPDDAEAFARELATSHNAGPILAVAVEDEGSAVDKK